MPESLDASEELSTATLRQMFPEIEHLLPEGVEYRWSSAERLARVRAELAAMRQVEAMGYHHRVEMHRCQALALFREDAASQSDGPATIDESSSTRKDR